jgi:hypothetical protein
MTDDIMLFRTNGHVILFVHQPLAISARVLIASRISSYGTIFYYSNPHKPYLMPRLSSIMMIVQPLHSDPLYIKPLLQQQ